jgi:CxxC motif-containing protein (DUF1111 family)
MLASQNARALCLSVLLFSCAGHIDTAEENVESVDAQNASLQTQSIVTGSSVGAPLSGLTTDQVASFDEGRDDFEEVEEADEGLGPVFNDVSCASCHNLGATGGAGTIVETRFGRIVNGVFDPLASKGGSLIQTTGIGVAGECNFQGETVPAEATIRSGRLTTPLFGLGLVDAVPDATFESLASSQRSKTPNTAGRTNKVTNVQTGALVVGKFGWKAQVPNLFQFSGDAYVNEMGITNPLFPNENCPGGNCALLACDPVPDPEDNGDGITNFKNFMTLLAPAPLQRPSNTDIATAIAALTSSNSALAQVGCLDCHTPTLTTGSSPIAALNQKTFMPLSDFLLHDMGSLGDKIGGQGRATGTEMRTAPLWGARFRTRFLHDGRATSVDAAIRAHDGQAKASRDRYVNLSASQRATILTIINSI